MLLVFTNLLFTAGASIPEMSALHEKRLCVVSATKGSSSVTAEFLMPDETFAAINGLEWTDSTWKALAGLKLRNFLVTNAHDFSENMEEMIRMINPRRFILEAQQERLALGWPADCVMESYIEECTLELAWRYSNLEQVWLTQLRFPDSSTGVIWATTKGDHAESDAEDFEEFVEDQ